MQSPEYELVQKGEHMNKNIKKFITFTAVAGTAMYAFNKLIDYTVNRRGLTLSENENYYVWRNGAIYYEKKGTGSPLLLIHDLNPISSSYEWSKVTDKLSQTHTVYAIDLLGCGKSDKPAISYVNYLFVQLISDFITHVIQQKTDLIVTGESFTFAVMAARMNPSLIGKITAINPTDITYNVQSPSTCSELIKHIFELPVIGTFIYNLVANTTTIQQQFRNKYYYDSTQISYTLPAIYYETAHLQGSNGKYLYASILGKYTNINIIHALKLIDHPIHFIVTDSASDEVNDYVKYHNDLTIDHIDKAGYLPQLEKPDKVLKLIR